MRNQLTKTDANAKFAVTDGLITTADTVVDGIQTDLSNATDGLGALKALIDTVDSVVDAITAKLPVRVARSASTLPQTAQTAYFTVTGGRVLISDIVGEVTVEIGAGANDVALWSNPTVGADVALCLDAGLDIDGNVVGTMYNITGTFADAMIATTSGAFSSQATPIVVSAGTIDLKCSASKAGQTKWTLFYIPLDAGATVTAA